MNIKSKLFIKNFQKDSGKGTLCLHQKIPFSWNSAPRKTGRIDSFYFLLFWFYYNMNHFLFQTILLSFHLLPYIWRLNIDNICLASYSFSPVHSELYALETFSLFFPLWMPQRHRNMSSTQADTLSFSVSPVPSEVSGPKTVFNYL